MRAIPPRHPAQERILRLLAERPGASLQDLAQALGLTRTATLHHTRRLARDGLLRAVRQGRRLLHFAAAVAPPAQTLLGLLNLHTARQVVETLAHDPAASWRQLARHLGITPRAVRWHIRRLEREQAIQVEASRFGPGHVTVLSPALRALLAPAPPAATVPVVEPIAPQAAAPHLPQMGGLLGP